jgi:hypothetical protein
MSPKISNVENVFSMFCCKFVGFVCEFGGEEKGGFWKKGARGKNRGFWEGRVLRDSFFFIIQNPPNLEELKNCIGESF